MPMTDLMPRRVTLMNNDFYVDLFFFEALRGFCETTNA
jgi:hypothetical protein